MRKPNFFLLLAASGSAIALLVFPAALSAAGGKPTRIAITDEQQSFHLRAGRVCSFEFDAAPVSNNQYITTYPADANGDVRMNVTGTLKERLTNVGAGTSIVVDVSGPATQIVVRTAVGTSLSKGRSSLATTRDSTRVVPLRTSTRDARFSRFPTTAS